MDSNNLSMMDTLLCTNMDNKEKQVRLISVQYAGEIFESKHVSSRYTLLLGAGDMEEEVSRSAKRYLYGGLNDIEKKDGVSGKDIILPPFEAMINFILKKSNVRSSSKNKISMNGVSLPFNPVVYSEILDYLRICLLNTAIPELIPQKQWLSQPTYEAPLISQYLNKLYESTKDLVNNFIKFAERLLEAKNGLQQSLAVLQIIGCTSTKTFNHFENKINWLRSLFERNPSRMFGIILLI
ncbi:ECM29 [Lepeophtheirus salmonis]|uniref:ECM29 n=1 Tax=Lepeophtheirus salmonis TaxID=72036 RepID=A0A7R8H9F3_LEPSM|nr:ECM29 [Lepeophtheirus salmonis]CAF2955387.1 ECM29 [Lepeophtheirus salmonis]